MIYPNFLEENDIIGITALSSGCHTISCVIEMKQAICNLKQEGFRVYKTKNVFGEELVSSSVPLRIKELNELLIKDIKALIIARGGDFLYELLPYLDYDKIKNKNIWFMGYSDPTSLLYILTTKYDLSTIYGLNAKSFSDIPLLDYEKKALEILRGNIDIQQNYDKELKSIYGNFEDLGIMIGGCLDVLRYIIGTKYDNTTNFIEKYKEKGIIWYFDIYNMTSIDVYLTLCQIKEAGWFKYSKTFIIGKVLLPYIENNFTYENAYKKALFGNILYDTNIGHVKPCFTIINGSIGRISYKDGTLIIKQELLKDDNSTN